MKHIGKANFPCYQTTTESKWWQRCGEIEALYIADGNVKRRTTVKTVQQSSKIKSILPYDLAIPLLGIYPRELKTGT